MKNGFITLVGLLVVLLIIVFLFIKMYSKNPATQKSQIDTYKESVNEAENVKKLLESRSTQQ